MRDHRQRMIDFILSDGKSNFGSVKVAGYFFDLEWLTNEQLAEITKKEIRDWRSMRKIRRENAKIRMARHA